MKTFKRMKDYILENRDLIGQRELLQLSMETANNRIEISKINSDMINVYQMSGNQITVRTLDLNLPFDEIVGQLNTIAKTHFDL